jgi:2-polyprenyl-3-methyl-5-hydroxy-6-metoxy-1,4-benzoquinol methylase
MSADDHARLDEIARGYDPFRDYDGVLRKFAWNILRERIAKDARVLEMGCSTGVLTLPLAEHVRDLWVVDGSKTYLDEVARKLAGKPVRLDLAFFEDYAPGVTFDHVVMAGAVEHLREPRPVLEHVRSWLGTTGELHVFAPNARSFHRLVGVAMGMLPDPFALNERDHAMGHFRVYDADTLCAELEGAGMEILEVAANSLKFLSNAQMMQLDPKLWDALFEVGKQFPKNGAETYVRCRARR